MNLQVKNRDSEGQKRTQPNVRSSQGGVKTFRQYTWQRLLTLNGIKNKKKQIYLNGRSNLLKSLLGFHINVASCQ